VHLIEKQTSALMRVGRARYVGIEGEGLDVAGISRKLVEGAA